MADKEATLSIVLRTVDKATSGLRAFNAKLETMTAPIKGLSKAWKDVKENIGVLTDASGLPRIIDGFKGVGSAVMGILGKLALIGGIAGAAVAGLVHLVGEFDDLGDLAERLGVHVDFLAQMRFAAERSGASVEALDQGFQTFTANLGLARAGMGKMVKALQTVAPDLLKQLKATKSNEEAILLMADAFSAVKDPAKRAALALRTGLGPELAPLLAKGSKGVAELMERYHELAGSEQDAADKAGEVDDSFKDLGAATNGIKAALVSGLGPALKQIVDEMASWFSENRERITEWAQDFGQKLPERIHRFADSLFHAIDVVGDLVDGIGGLKTVAIVVAGVLVGPLVSALTTLSVALLTTPAGPFILAIGAIAASVALLVHDLNEAVTAFEKLKSVSSFLVGSGGGVAALGGGSKVGDAISAIRDQPGFHAAAGPATMLRRLISPEALNTASGATAQSSEVHLKVDFNNTPPGTRVTASPKNTADVDLSVGYQLAGFGA